MGDAAHSSLDAKNLPWWRRPLRHLPYPGRQTLRCLVSEVTLLLNALAAGDSGAADRLYAKLYPDLNRLARAHLRSAGSITLDPSALIHELWLRTRSGDVPGHRAQFFALASRVMRSVVVDHLRRRMTDKRGGGVAELTLDTEALREFAGQAGGLTEAAAQSLDLVQLDAALQDLAAADERAHRVVEMRFFGGMLQEQIAEALGVSLPTVKRDWRRARAYLFERLRP